MMGILAVRRVSVVHRARPFSPARNNGLGDVSVLVILLLVLSGPWVDVASAAPFPYVNGAPGYQQVIAASFHHPAPTAGGGQSFLCTNNAGTVIVPGGTSPDSTGCTTFSGSPFARVLLPGRTAGSVATTRFIEGNGPWLAAGVPLLVGGTQAEPVFDTAILFSPELFTTDQVDKNIYRRSVQAVMSDGTVVEFAAADDGWIGGIAVDGTTIVLERLLLTSEPAFSRSILKLVPNVSPVSANVTLGAARMVTRSKLGIDLALAFRFRPRSGVLKLAATVNGISLAKTVDLATHLQPNGAAHLNGASEPLRFPGISFDFAEAGVPTFVDDASFTLTAEVSGGGATGSDAKQVTIPLPVVYVHGYTGPVPSDPVGVFVRSVIGELVRPQAFILFEKLGAASQTPFRTPYDAEDNSPYRTLWFPRYDDVGATPSQIVDRLHYFVTGALGSTHANRVNMITHSTGGLVARHYLSLVKPAVVKKLIMVASPNQGLSEAYLRTSGFTRAKFDRLLNKTVGGFLIPRASPGDSSSAQVRLYLLDKSGKPCRPLDLSRLRPPSLASTFADSAPPEGVEVTNLYATGRKTSWDVLATPTRDWFRFSKRSLFAAFACDPRTDWDLLRRGDGTVAIRDAFLDYPNVKNVALSIATPHALLLSDARVKGEVFSALGLK